MVQLLVKGAHEVLKMDWIFLLWAGMKRDIAEDLLSVVFDPKLINYTVK